MCLKLFIFGNRHKCTCQPVNNVCFPTTTMTVCSKSTALCKQQQALLCKMQSMMRITATKSFLLTCQKSRDWTSIEK